MGELLTERIATNARELKLLGLAETADSSSTAPRPQSSATASSWTSCWSPRWGCSRAAATPPG